MLNLFAQTTVTMSMEVAPRDRLAGSSGYDPDEMFRMELAEIYTVDSIVSKQGLFHRV